MLKIKNINTYYGKLHALKNVSLHVSAGEIVALIGSNGAGKTTILNTVSAVTPPANGEIHFDGMLISRLSPDAIVKMGVSQVPEGRQIFKPLSVEDNLELGAYLRSGAGERRKDIMKDKDAVYALFPRLGERRKQIAGTLSGGEQQMLAIGRALMAKPRLLLLRTCDGTCSAAGAGNISGHRGTPQGAGNFHTSRRTKRTGGAEGCRSGICAGNGQSNSRRDGSGASGE